MMSLQVTKIIWVTGLANQLFKEHGLEERGWSFDLDQTKQQVGVCNHHTKKIGFSLYYLEKSSDAEIRDTILHEIAHALVGSNHGHDATWRAKCIEIGARPKRLAGEDAVTTAKPNYVMICPSCDRKWYRYRMRQRNYGGKCPDCKIEVEIYNHQTGERIY
jgi:predicted SprT family Zn-dependent metalloprotease